MFELLGILLLGGICKVISAVWHLFFGSDDDDDDVYYIKRRRK
jgi:hypothetical protein